MSPVSPLQVRHIAKLARLLLNGEEVETFAKEIGSILAYVDMLKEVDTHGVEPTAQIVGLSGILRDDVIRSPDAPPDALLATSPLPIRTRQIETPAAHG